MCAISTEIDSGQNTIADLIGQMTKIIETAAVNLRVALEKESELITRREYEGGNAKNI